MSTGEVRGTARERRTVVALTLLGGVLPLVAMLPLFHGFAWLLWVAALALILSALALVLRITIYGRRSRDY